MSTTAFEDVRHRLGDRYEIVRELGRGGMGTVYLARDVRLDRQVALKVLPAEFAADVALRDRFLRETRTAASFSHPNIVPVHAVEERDELLAFAMGYVEGESIAERVQRTGPLSVRELVRVLQDIAYALAYAHGRGVVHRDIKPDNIMIERATGRALLMDFGISRAITTTVETRGLTRVGEVVGTPEYMSPEQASGDAVDGRSDIYSLGLVAFFAATGVPAITGETTQKVLVNQLTQAVAPVASHRHGLPASLAAAIDRCTAKQPEDRFATAELLVETIDEAQLAAPEIPLPIRLFTQELGTLSLIIAFSGLISWFIVRTLSRSVSTFDAFLPVIVLAGIVITRVMQTLAEARRLSVAGFTPTETLKGMHAVLEERESLRSQWRSDPAVRRRRRNTLIVAALQLPVALLLIYAALAMRVQVSETQYRSSIGGITMVVTGLVLIGVSMVLVARSPIRMPVGERLFRRVWLGPLGRAFLRMAARGVSQPSGDVDRAGRSGSRRGAVPVMAPVPPRSEATAGTPSLAALDARVTALERWREERT